MSPARFGIRGTALVEDAALGSSEILAFSDQAEDIQRARCHFQRDEMGRLEPSFGA